MIKGNTSNKFYRGLQEKDGSDTVFVWVRVGVGAIR